MAGETPKLEEDGSLNTRGCLRNDNIHYTVTCTHVHLIRLKMHDGTVKVIHIIHVLFFKSLSLETYGELLFIDTSSLPPNRTTGRLTLAQFMDGFNNLTKAVSGWTPR